MKPVEEPEDSGLEEGDDDNELVDATETGKGSQSLKKKEESNQESIREEDGQASLFGKEGTESKTTNKSQGPKVNGKDPQPLPKKQKAHQASLFGEDEKKEVKSKEQAQSKAFTVGDSIELEL